MLELNSVSLFFVLKRYYLLSVFGLFFGFYVRKKTGSLKRLQSITLYGILWIMDNNRKPKEGGVKMKDVIIAEWKADYKICKDVIYNGYIEGYFFTGYYNARKDMCTIQFLGRRSGLPENRCAYRQAVKRTVKKTWTVNQKREA